LNGVKFATRGQAVVIGRWALPILIALPMVFGCGKAAPPPVEGRLAIENIAKWRQLYLANHGRKPPANEAEFVDFIEKKMKERGETFDREAFLVSPRDGQKFVVQYGSKSAKLDENSVAVHEKEGYDGKVLVAFESARSAEVDAAKLPSLLAAKP
jgi:hypothetical protein